MNRIEFMTELEQLLKDIPQEERVEAMKYYFDYFSDAGPENEANVIQELGSPQKVAATIKADMGMQDASSEYSETGYTDTRFEEKETPIQRGQTGGQSNPDGPRTSKVLKIVLIILIAIAASTVALPVVGSVLAVVFGLLIAAFSIFIGFVFGAIGIMLAGLVIFIIGLTKLAVAAPVGLLTTGAGILLFVLGMIATVGTIKLCMIVYPAMIRGIVYLCRIPFYGKNGKAV